jgi:alpha-tubulin suppressor-like RCC1 family protein
VLVKALEGSEVSLIKPGQHHTLFLTSDGSVLSAGRPTYGRLGRRALDTASDAAMPAPEPVEAAEGGLAGARVVGLAAGARLLLMPAACGSWHVHAACPRTDALRVPAAWCALTCACCAACQAWQ